MERDTEESGQDLTQGSLELVDIKFKLGVSGTLQFWRNDELLGTFNFVSTDEE